MNEKTRQAGAKGETTTTSPALPQPGDSRQVVKRSPEEVTADQTKWIARWTFFAFLSTAIAASVAYWSYQVTVKSYELSEKSYNLSEESEQLARIRDYWRILADARNGNGNIGQKAAIEYLYRRDQNITGIDLSCHCARVIRENLKLNDDNTSNNETQLESRRKSNNIYQECNHSSRQCQPLEGLDLTGYGAADLSFSSFLGANLSNSNLSNAKLYRANFDSANLVAANLSGANLRDANFRSADMVNADMSGADFRNADISDANFFSTWYDENGIRHDPDPPKITEDQLRSACIRNGDRPVLPNSLKHISIPECPKYR